MTKETGLNEMFPNGGIFVNPLDDGEITNAIESMLDKNTYDRHTQDLRENNFTHSWFELAKDFIEIWGKI